MRRLSGHHIQAQNVVEESGILGQMGRRDAYRGGWMLEVVRRIIRWKDGKSAWHNEAVWKGLVGDGDWWVTEDQAVLVLG